MFNLSNVAKKVRNFITGIMDSEKESIEIADPVVLLESQIICDLYDKVTVKNVKIGEVQYTISVLYNTSNNTNGLAGCINVKCVTPITDHKQLANRVLEVMFGNVIMVACIMQTSSCMSVTILIPNGNCEAATDKLIKM